MLSVRPSVCPSVRLSVTFRYRDHIDWNSSKIISRPNSLCSGRPQHGPSGATGTPPKLGRNMGGVTRESKKPAIHVSPKRCKIGPRLLLRTNIKSYTRFRLVPKSRPWMTLNGVSRDCPKIFTYPLLFQERVKLRTSNLAGTFIGSIGTLKHVKNFGEKRHVGVSRDCPKFLSTPYYLRNG